MTKKQFTKAIRELIHLKNTAQKISDAVRLIDNDFNFFTLGRAETLIVYLLEKAMNDKDEWIVYWLYELDCGKKAKPNSVQFKGKNVPSKTISDLYNLIKNA